MIIFMACLAAYLVWAIAHVAAEIANATPPPPPRHAFVKKLQ